jgi:hypothetical protein
LQFLSEFGQPVAAAMRLDQTPAKALLKLRDPALDGGLVHPQRFGGCLHAAGAGESKKFSHDEHEGCAMTASSRVTRCTITLAVYVALQLGSVVLGIAISHKPAATSGTVMALEDAPKVAIDIIEAF